MLLVKHGILWFGYIKDIKCLIKLINFDFFCNDTALETTHQSQSIATVFLLSIGSTKAEDGVLVLRGVRIRDLVTAISRIALQVNTPAIN